MPGRLRYTDGMLGYPASVNDRALHCLLRGTAIFAVVLLAGCQLLPFEREARDEDHPPGETEPESGSAAVPQTNSVGQALAHLQKGQAASAESILEQVLEADPGSTVARLLLTQIRQPPALVLGGEATMTIEVQPGDTLSGIAGRYLGNELLFFALARLNGIGEPRLLRPGQQLKVPVPGEPEKPAPPEKVGAAAEDTASPGVGPTARALMQKGRPVPAYALLLSTARAGKLESASADLLAETAVELSQSAIESGDLDRARQYLDQAAPWLEGFPADATFARQVTKVNAAQRLVLAGEALEKGDYAAAYEAWTAASDHLDRQQSMPTVETESLRAELREHYHSRALDAWRDQEVEQAVHLWERVLAVDPDFKPATVYLERARRAQRRLEAFDGTD